MITPKTLEKQREDDAPSGPMANEGSAPQLSEKRPGKLKIYISLIFLAVGGCYGWNYHEQSVISSIGKHPAAAAATSAKPNTDALTGQMFKTRATEAAAAEKKQPTISVNWVCGQECGLSIDNQSFAAERGDDYGGGIHIMQIGSRWADVSVGGGIIRRIFVDRSSIDSNLSGVGANSPGRAVTQPPISSLARPVAQ